MKPSLIPHVTTTRLLAPKAHTGRLVAATAATVFAFLIWAAWSPLDQITRGNGQVIASSRTQLVQALDGGIIHSLNVREGDSVRRGQLLAKIESAKAEAAVKESAARAAALRANIVRLKSEVFGSPLEFGEAFKAYPEFVANQRILFAKRQSAIREEVAALQAALVLVKKELEMNLPLLKTGDVSQADVLRLQRQVADLMGQITYRKNKYLQDSQAELSKAEEDLAGVEQILAQRQEQFDNTHLTAPMDGIVKNVRVTSQGGVLRPGEELLSIVPAGDELLVEAKIRPADMAYVKPGLPATVKFDAWDYSIHGGFPGKVSYLSADTLTEESQQGTQTYYRVKVSLPSQSLVSTTGKKIDLQPGMTALVEIKTGTQTVLQYLTKPITKTFAESLGER